MLIVVTIATALALAGVGGGLYEFLVVDASWPKRPDLIQPRRGGVSRKRFWVPMHVAFELAMIAALVLAWSRPEIRAALIVAFASHAVSRIWSLFDFIPKALQFERADPASVTEQAARRWTRRSMGRLPFALVTCGAMLTAFATAARLA